VSQVLWALSRMPTRSPRSANWWQISAYGILLVVAMLAAGTVAEEHRVLDETRTFDLHQSLLQLEAVLEPGLNSDEVQDLGADSSAESTAGSTPSAMTAAQVAAMVAQDKADIAAENAASDAMADEKATIEANETKYSANYTRELTAIEANYTSTLAWEKFHLEKPFIKQAAEYIGQKFQEAAVVHQVQKICDAELHNATVLQLQNLDAIAVHQDQIAGNENNASIADFVTASIEAALNRPQAHPAVVVPTVVPGSVEHNELISTTNPSRELGEGEDVTSLDDDATYLGEGENVADSGSVNQPDSEDNSLSDRIKSIAWSVAQPQFDLPAKPTLIDTDEQMPPDTNMTFDSNAYAAILDLGENSTGALIATRSLILKNAEKLEKIMKWDRKDTWHMEIDSKAKLKADKYLMGKINNTKELLHERLRQELDLDHNATQRKIQEHLLENKASPRSVKGARIVYEQTHVVEYMKIDEDGLVLEKADEALGRAYMTKVLRAYQKAYWPKLEYDEEDEIRTRARSQATDLVKGRFSDIKAQRAAERASERQTKLQLQHTMDSISNEDRSKTNAVNQKVDQVYTYVKQYGDIELDTKMKSAIDDLKLAKLDHANGDMEALGKAAAAQIELDNAIALASASIGGSVGQDVLRLKIEIDALRNPDEDLLAGGG